MKIEFFLNGRRVETEVKGRDRLLDILWRLGIRSVKEGCGTGDCGTCNVLVDGRLINSCMMLAVQARGKNILTVEGLSKNEKALSAIQKAMIEYTASQCGYCIPGIIMTAKYIQDNYPQADEETIRHILISNICRCGGYTRIVSAIKEALGSPPP